MHTPPPAHTHAHPPPGRGGALGARGAGRQRPRKQRHRAETRRRRLRRRKGGRGLSPGRSFRGAPMHPEPTAAAGARLPHCPRACNKAAPRPSAAAGRQAGQGAPSLRPAAPALPQPRPGRYSTFSRRMYLAAARGQT